MAFFASLVLVAQLKLLVISLELHLLFIVALRALRLMYSLDTYHTLELLCVLYQYCGYKRIAG